MTQRKQKPKVGVVLEPEDYEELQRQTPAGGTAHHMGPCLADAPVAPGTRFRRAR